MPLALLMVVLCVPGFLIKQITNMLQLRAAMRMLVAHDRTKTPVAFSSELQHKAQ
jgi:hypothetical protein